MPPLANLNAMPPVLSLRSKLVAVKDGVEGVLHPLRGGAARRRLQRMAGPSVLFVCLGNVCRSPYGERVLKTRAGSGWNVLSAGFIGPDRAPPETALRVARRRGVVHDDHRSRLVTPRMLASADTVFFFDRHNRARLLAVPGVRPQRLFWLGDFDPEWDGKRAIPDPWGKADGDFERVFARIERCVDQVWDIVGARVTP
ncbi:MAG TPA: hypothetical protein VK849_05625 [Longimicrobiales bacterium]|nr:hypothetical protein [Longimicrobiales bacterium]